MISAAIFVLLSAQASADTGLPKYIVSGSPGEGLQFDVERFAASDWPRVDDMIRAEANQRCAPKVAHFYSYKTVDGPMTVDGKPTGNVVGYKRTMLCVDPAPLGAPAPAGFKPSPQDDAVALASFYEYFAAFDAEDVDAVIRLSDGPSTPRTLTADMMRRIKTELGVGKRVAFNSLWTIDPPGQHQGAFVDILYYHSLPNDVTICGRALFYRADAKTYRFSRNLMRPAKTLTSGQANPC